MSNILQESIIKTLGLDGLSDEEKVLFLDQLGTIVLETALLRLVESLSDERVSSLNYYLDTEPTTDALMERLLNHYPDFSQILEKTITELKEDMKAVLGDVDVIKTEGGI